MCPGRGLVSGEEMGGGMGEVNAGGSVRRWE